MKNILRKNAIILLSLGMFVVAISQITSRFYEISDVTKGLFFGIGIGLLILAVTFGNFKTVQ